eukprot:11262597-Karenia_brevis.AAC.1
MSLQKSVKISVSSAKFSIDSAGRAASSAYNKTATVICSVCKNGDVHAQVDSGGLQCTYGRAE